MRRRSSKQEKRLSLRALSIFQGNRYDDEDGGDRDSREVEDYEAGGRPQQMTTLDFASLAVHGRNTEVSLCEEAIERVKNGAFEMIFAHGPSGCGKSRLIEVTMNPSPSSDFMFVSGKYDQLRETAQPYSALVEAFTQLCNCILRREDSVTIAAKLHKNLGKSCRSLLKVIPALELVLSLVDSDISVDEESYILDGREVTQESFGRFRHFFRLLLRTVSSIDHPVILFFDNIQWADTSSLEVLAHLATDPEVKYTMLVMAYRDNSADLDPLIDEIISFMKQHHKEKQTITDVHLGDLDFEGVKSLVAELLHQDIEDVKSLAVLVYRKTRGNCFFVIQFLTLLEEEERLRFDVHESRWVWDENSIALETQVSDNVADVLVGRIGKLPKSARMVLKLAGCLGKSLDSKVITRILFSEDHGMSFEQAKDATQEGIYQLMKTGMIEGGPGSTFKFAHDRIQQAAYSLVPKNDGERLSLHARIGILLYQMYEASLEDWMFFSAVDQLNLGSPYIADEAERLELAEFNLKAGKEAMLKSAFFPAAAYAKAGLALMDESSLWKAHYELALGLNFLSAETNMCCGNVVECRQAALTVIRHSDDLVTNAKTFIILVNLLGESGEVEEAVAFGREGLRILGVRLPKKPNLWNVMLETTKTKALVRRKLASDSLLNAPVAHDEQTIVGMHLMSSVMYYLFSVDGMYALIGLVCRMVRISLTKGLCPSSPHVLATFMSIMASTGSVADARKLGKLCLIMAEQPFARDFISATSAIYYANLELCWSKPLEHSVNPLLESCKVGMEHGRVKYALTCSLLYCSLAYISGSELEPLAEDIKKFIALMDEFGQGMLKTSLTGLDQLVLQLIGKRNRAREGPSRIDLAAFPNHKEMEDQFGQRMIMNYHRELCYFLNEPQLRAQLTAEMGTESIVTFRFHFVFVRESFMTGLCLLDLLRSGKGNSKTERAVRKCTKRFKTWLDDGAMSCEHMLLLLKAEQMACRKRVGVYEAAKMYERAVAVAHRNGAMHDEALCNEVAAEFFRQHDDYFSFKRHIEQAFDLYLAWGAIEKAKQMEATHECLSARADFQIGSHSGSRSGTNSRSSARSKARFTPASTRNMRKLSFDIKK